ncbi:MAG: DUF4156 domain-containing protein [Gammaproteobacteria bacterium]|nr:MAG: DUF4156 domain-containing protein [Gammaproteobacteria bacterium]
MIAGRWLPLAALPALLLASACSPWVKLSDGGAGVTHVTAATAADRCTRVGRVSAVTQQRVAGVGRNDERVRAELLTMARNEAASLGANSVVATSEITDGRQNFDALNCER